MWQKEKGSANRYINTDTGETISRRQYDRTYGVLKKQGFTSYEQREKSEVKQVQNFKLSKTGWHSHVLGGNFFQDTLIKRIKYIYDKQRSNFGNYYGMSLYVRIDGIAYGTPILDLYDFQGLIDELKKLVKKYGSTIDDEEDEDTKDTAVLTFHVDNDI